MNQKGDLSEHFSRSEFACQCGCGVCDVSPELLRRLEHARELAGISFAIRSGCRCPKHNADEKGKADSAHLAGIPGEICEAADIATPDSRTRFLVMMGMILAGFKRIEDADSWIHGDVDTTKPQEVLFRK